MWKILAVDDEATNLKMIRQILKEKYKLVFAKNGQEALIAAGKHAPDLILLDVMMPEMDGYDTCRNLKENPKTVNIPVIFFTALGEIDDEAKGFDIGGVDYIRKPISARILKARIATHLALYDQNRALEAKVLKRTNEIHTTRLKIIQRLGRAAEYKDNETGLHVVRMSNFSKIIALKAGIPENQSELILNAAPMHDIGKIGIPDNILQKPGPLDDEEWKIMRTHSKIGAEIIGQDDSELLQMAWRIAFSHHEKWDGSGYPKRLASEDIPLEARIVAIADVFDALTSIRPYKDAWPVEKALNLMRDNSGKHFDPSLLTAFLGSMPEILAVKKEWAETNV